MTNREKSTTPKLCKWTLELWFSFESGSQAADIRQRGVALRSLAEQHAHECYDLLHTYYALDPVLMRTHFSFIPHSNSMEQMLFVLTISQQRTLGSVPLSGAHWPWPRPFLSEVECLWPDGSQAAWLPIFQLNTILPLDKTNQESGIWTACLVTLIQGMKGPGF